MTKQKIEKLINCIEHMATSMQVGSLPEELSIKLVSHVLYDEQYENISGKNGWASYQNRLITERELRNLLMAHAATKICNFNKLNEPVCKKYISEKLCHKFEIALFGRLVVLQKIDLLDSWE